MHEGRGLISIGRMETKEPPASTSGDEPIEIEPTLEADPPNVDSESDADELDGASEADEASEASAPPVVAVVVTTGGKWLDAAIASLAAQDYPALSVLVLDNAGADDLTVRIASEMPTAFVRRLPENRG